ncbi:MULTISPECIES: Hpt domain-containing protein [Emticicia]|uniref:Hpt domain-containing protein n=1 Tax=Emticicia TaxID=312278 RepID=UPI0020A082AE|nr:MULTISPECIES: Hpt domain-containing protein [Emticicia]UTA69534.1 Hpt domain-containing protein [Emticicia sp. 21SJ11W-3]
MFEFNAHLDADYINEIYGGDLSIVQIMFNSFLEESIPVWNEIQEQINQKNFNEVGRLAHQIKPSFSMVGLTFLHPKMQAFESYAKANPEAGELNNLYQQIAVDVNHAKLVIEEDLKRMEDYL